MFYGVVAHLYNSGFVVSVASVDAFPILTGGLTLLFALVLVLSPAVNVVYNIIVFVLIVMWASLFVGSLTKFYFLSFAFCLIYIGAISVLFIFTLMTIAVRPRLTQYRHKIFFLNVVTLYSSFYYMICFIFFYSSSDFFVVDYTFLTTQIFKEYFFNYFYSTWIDLTLLGFYIFNYRFLEILILTFLLVSGLVCSISIVVFKSFSPKNQNTGYQLKTNNSLMFVLRKKKNNV